MVFSCTVCDKTYIKKRHLRLHNARQHTDKTEWTNKCEICDKLYADPEILERHMKSHLVQIDCPIDGCVTVFSSISAMHKHRKTIHDPDFVPLNKEKKKYTCNECGVSYSKHNLLAQHSYEHTGILPFNCGKCDKAFLTLAHRNRHEKVHNGYGCSQCANRFETWTKLRSHVAEAHSRVYRCSQCDKTFSMACRLNVHSKVHSEKRKVFKCQECDRTFVTKNNLKTHIAKHHQQERPFTCDVASCNKSFAYKQSLQKHMKTHSPDYVRVTCKRSGKKRIPLVSRLTGINPCQKVEIAVES